jgi:hypothetical protein
MRKIGTAFAAVGLAAAPALAIQQDQAEGAAPTPPRTLHGELVLYQMKNYNGDYYTVDGPSSRVRTDWNIRSVTIHPGDRWQICARPRFQDPCIVLDRSVHDASLIGVEGQIGSARLAPDEEGE